MGALNAAPNQNPFAFELQRALLHYSSTAADPEGCICFLGCNNGSQRRYASTNRVPPASNTHGADLWPLNKS
jgi:hypothetical protein